MKPVVGKKYRSLWGVKDLWTVTEVGDNVLLYQDVAEEGWGRATRGCPLHLFAQHYEDDMDWLKFYKQTAHDQGSQISEALDIIHQYGGIDGEHHKQWVLDQVVRILAGDEYQSWLDEYCRDDDAYSWDEGIAP